VYLQLDNEPGFFSDNFFDLLPGQLYEIELITSIAEEKMKEAFNFRTLTDAFWPGVTKCNRLQTFCKIKYN
jgi:beta-mannosidase